jgi:hypothetical protein
MTPKTKITLTRHQLSELVSMGADAMFYQLISVLPREYHRTLLFSARKAQNHVHKEFLNLYEYGHIDFDREQNTMRLTIPDEYQPIPWIEDSER